MHDGRRHIFSGALIEELSGISRAVVVGDMIFVSGTNGIDPQTGDLAQGAEAQTQHSIDSIEAALTEAESGLEDIVRMRIYLSDMSDAAAVARMLRSRVGGYYPAATTVGATLALPGALVEIEVEALRGSGNRIA